MVKNQPKFGSCEAPLNEGMSSRKTDTKDKEARGQYALDKKYAKRSASSQIKSAPPKEIKWKLIGVYCGLALLILLIINSNGKKETQVTPSPIVESHSNQSSPSDSITTSSTKAPLSFNELVFCLAEDIRLDAALKVANKINVEILQNRIDQYNTECINATYHTKDMDIAEPQVKARKQIYIREGERLVTKAEITYVSVYVTDEKTGGGFGKGTSINSAKSAALHSCKAKYPTSTCIERLSGKGNCIAVANDASGRKASAGIGDSPEIAERNALRMCNQTHQDCQIPRDQSVCEIN